MSEIIEEVKKVIKTDDGNLFEVKHDEKNGYSLISRKTRTEYDLLEGMSWHGKSSSGIVFIMKVDPELGYTNLINFTFVWEFGPAEANNADGLNDGLIYCAKYIEDYENGKVVDLGHYFG